MMGTGICHFIATWMLLAVLVSTTWREVFGRADEVNNSTFIKVMMVGDRPLKFFWYPQGTTSVPAFLEGGPNPNYKDSVAQIRFFLFTKKNPDKGQEITIGDTEGLFASNFVANESLKLITHGFAADMTDGPVPDIKNAYLHAEPNHNVIGVDWGPLAAAPWYDTAAKATEIVGKKTALLVKYLVSIGYITIDQVHFLGHSLGAHIGGFMGAALSGKAGRITGLDPALPLFADVSDSKRLDKTDGVFVDVIHTAGGTVLEGGLAFTSSIGHIDFYPNGGHEQPGCGYDAFGTCSHARSYLYMAESISLRRGFLSCECTSWNDYIHGGSNCGNTTNMGEYASQQLRGKFCLRTSASKPFSQNISN